MSTLKAKIAIVSLLAIAQLAPLPAQAEEVQVPCGASAFYQITLPAGVALGGGKCEGALSVDSRVKIIGKGAFNSSKITSVVLPDGVISIEDSAFSYLNLTSISLGKSLQSIGFEAFRGSRFSSVELPETLRTIGESAFADTYFRTIKLPASLETIGRTAFAREDSGAVLESIALPNSLVNLEYAAFVRSGLKKLTLGSGLNTISASAFEGNQLTELTLPSNIKFIQAFAFRNNPIEKITFSEGLQLVDSEAFSKIKVEKLLLPQSLVSIGTMAFARNPLLKEIDLSDNFEGFTRSDKTQTVGDIFSESYAIQKISYCGVATGFYVPATCDGERKAKAVARQKSESDRIAAEEKEKAAIQSSFEVEQAKSIAEAVKKAAVSDVPITIKVTGQNPTCPADFQLVPGVKSSNARGTTILCQSIVKSEAERNAAREQQKIEEEKARSEVAASSAKPLNAETSKAVSQSTPTVNKRISITCVKGKATKVVSGASPKCPKGYTVRKK